MKRLLIIGAGGHARSVAEAVLISQDYVLTGFLDDAAKPMQRLLDLPVWGTMDALLGCRGQVDLVTVAIGNNALREKLHDRVRNAGFSLATIIHPAAIVSPTAIVGQGSVILAGAIVGAYAQLGEGVILNCGAVVDHDCRVEPFGHLGVNAGMAGNSVLGRRAWMSIGASISRGVKVEADRVLRAGEAVLDGGIAGLEG